MNTISECYKLSKEILHELNKLIYPKESDRSYLWICKYYIEVVHMDRLLGVEPKFITSQLIDELNITNKTNIDNDKIMSIDEITELVYKTLLGYKRVSDYKATNLEEDMALLVNSKYKSLRETLDKVKALGEENDFYHILFILYIEMSLRLDSIFLYNLMLLLDRFHISHKDSYIEYLYRSYTPMELEYDKIEKYLEEVAKEALEAKNN